MRDKIEDNASYKNLRKDIEDAESLRLLPYLLPGSELDSTMLEKILTQLDDIKKQHEISSKAPDKFNHYFATRGWIAHESMNLNLMLACIELAEKGQVADAEQELIDYYTTDKINWLELLCKCIQSHNNQYMLIYFTYADTIAVRSHSSIPHLSGVINR